jgi:hypothetical protein
MYLKNKKEVFLGWGMWSQEGKHLPNQISYTDFYTQQTKHFSFSTDFDYQLAVLLLTRSKELLQNFISYFTLKDCNNDFYAFQISFNYSTCDKKNCSKLLLKYVELEIFLMEELIYHQFLLQSRLGKVIHDVKTPLSSLMLAIELLEDDPSQSIIKNQPINGTLKKFSDYCRWMPKQFQHLKTRDVEQPILDLSYSVNNYVSHLSRFCSSHNIHFVLRKGSNFNNFYFVTISGLEWWLELFVESINLIFFVENVQIEIDDYSIPSMRLKSIFTFFLSESFNNNLSITFNNNNLFPLKYMAVLRRLSSLGFDCHLSCKDSNKIVLSLLTPILKTL